MITYKQIEPDFIQTHETHADGSYTSGIIRRYETKTRAIDAEISAIDAETNETYSPWNELDPSLVEWLDVPVWQSAQDADAALALFKSSRQTLIDEAVVDANGFSFDSDEVSIGRMASAVLAAIDELDTFVMQWSLADTATGVMTSVTLGDLKLAHKLAVLNMSAVWGVV
tara:strand:- start:2264 stop:2773 length:510 start_codon:yes stop_codon:yes gene_type:complete